MRVQDGLGMRLHVDGLLHLTTDQLLRFKEHHGLVHTSLHSVLHIRRMQGHHSALQVRIEYGSRYPSQRDFRLHQVKNLHGQLDIPRIRNLDLDHRLIRLLA